MLLFLAKASTLLRIQQKRSVHLLLHRLISAILHDDRLIGNQFHLKRCHYSRLYGMKKISASMTASVDDSKLDWEPITAQELDSSSHEVVDANMENRHELPESNCKVNTTSTSSSQALPSNEVEDEKESGHIKECSTLSKADREAKLENEAENTSEKGTNDPKSDGTDLTEERDIEKNQNHLKRKRKSKTLNLHATFKRPKLTSDDELSQTVHYFENGLRKCVPYDFQYNTFCKGRWVGKTLGQLYTEEFRLYPIEYYERAVKERRVLVNLKPVKSLARIVKNNDLITSISHRHECPVSTAPITIVADTDEFFVINKPCSIPLHPAGRFRHNSLLSILARDFGRRDIFSIHRLDRMTSGLTVFTKTSQRANKCHTQIKERQVQKEYVCQVVGDFSKFSLPDNHDHRVEIDGDDVTVSESMKVYDMKIGTSIVSREDDAKDCLTSFKCLSTNGRTSIVRCKPKTGRTHQIRVHLQYLGFPITNDPMYNTSAWGDDRFRLGQITKPMQDVMQELSTMKKWVSVLESFEDTIRSDAVGHNLTEVQEASGAIKQLPDLSPAMLEAAGKVDGIVPYRADCEECKNPLPDPKPDELVMYLHALRYKGPDWEFETPLPEWASSDLDGGD